MHLAGNSLGLLICHYLLAGFNFTGSLLDLVAIGIFLTLFNTIFKPIIKFIFWPLIVLTLGIGLILINGFGLYLANYFFEALTISGILTLIWATLIIWVINTVLILSAKLLK